MEMFAPEKRAQALDLIQQLGEQIRQMDDYNPAESKRLSHQLEFFQSQQIKVAMAMGATPTEIVASIRRGAGFTA